MIDLTEEILDIVGTPTVVYAAVSLVAAQAAELEPDSTMLEGLIQWPENSAELYVENLRSELAAIRQWVQLVEAAIPEGRDG